MAARTAPTAPEGNRELILRAAREELAESGYKGATVRAIARRARVDPRLVRYYFPDRRGLLVEALARVDLDLARVSESPIEQQLVYLTDHHPVEWRALLAGAFSDDPELAEAFTRHARRIVPAAGSSGPDDPAALRELLRLGHAIGIWLLADDTVSRRELLRRHGAMLAMVRRVNDHGA